MFNWIEKHYLRLICFTAAVMSVAFFILLHIGKDASTFFAGALAFLGALAGVEQWRSHLKHKALERVESQLAFLHELISFIYELGRVSHTDKIASIEQYRQSIYDKYSKFLEANSERLYSNELYLGDNLLETSDELFKTVNEMNVSFSQWQFKKNYPGSFSVEEIQNEWMKAFVVPDSVKDHELNKWEKAIIVSKKKIRDKFYRLVV